VEDAPPPPYDLTDTGDDFYPKVCSMRPAPEGKGDYRNHLMWWVGAAAVDHAM
jgi:hypothetical protein